MKCSECSASIKPVVAIDIDGTMGDYHEHFLRFAEGYLGHPLERGWTGEGNWEDHLGISQELYREVKLAFRQGGMKRTMPIHPGAAEFTQHVSERGAEVWITTTRPWLRLDSVDPDTRDWLRRHHVRYDHLLYHDHKYIQLAQLVDPGRVALVLEDLPRQYEQAQETFGLIVPYMRVADHNSSFSALQVFKEFGGFIAQVADQRIERWYEGVPTHALA